MIAKLIRERKARICIIGLGYVGLPTAIHFCERGFHVIGVDNDSEKIDKISKGTFPTDDDELRARIHESLRQGLFTITSETQSAVKDSDIVIIIVPTPITATKEPDLSYVISASEETLKGLKKDHLVILESTTYPGTTEEVVKPILERNGMRAGEDFGLAYCPERYNPGDKEHTIENVSRIVGGITQEWGDITRQLYQTIIKENVILVDNIKTAEAAKVIENIQRDINIALFNELAMIFQRMNIDVLSVIEAASTKWNFVKLYPGPGVGGHCLPVDPYYLTHKARELGFHPQLILAGRAINDNMPLYVVNLIIDGLNELSKPVKNSKISVLGISYKANTGDLRESPARTIIKVLTQMGANVHVHDPFVDESDINKYLHVKSGSLEQVLRNSNCVLIHTYHDKFRKLDLKKIRKLVDNEALLVDTRFVFSPEEVRNCGMIYRGIGRGGIIHD